MNKKRRLFLFAIFLIVLAILSSCAVSEKSEPEEQAQYPAEEIVIAGPTGTELFIGPGALSQDAEIKVNDIGEGLPFADPSPLSAASAEYSVDLGGAEQIGEITMTVPLIGANKEAAPGGGDLVYLTWTEPEQGYPSVVGTIVEDNQATFPVVGSGIYQVFSLKSHAALLELVSIFDPLDVPTYPQRTPAWCSPTAMTNVVQYHQGSWPAGGLGSVWGESSNWYLAGRADQAHEEGRFFHQVLGAGGYTVPADVKQSFSNGNVEVIIWNWIALVDSGFSNPAFANILFNSYQAYVETYLWGERGDRRPVAWGSSLAGHSRTITGSDGEVFYFNNPSSGSWNDSKSWEVYRQEVIASLTADKTEVIDTTVFHAPPRPAEERRAVLWLLPRKDDGWPGSVALIAGDTGQPATNWHWDGSGAHNLGYYHEDLRGVFDNHVVFGSFFKATHFGDNIEFGFAIQSITDQSYDYSVVVALYNDSLTVLKTVGSLEAIVGGGQREYFIPADNFDIIGLPPDTYTIRFNLFQNGVLQDVKYVQFVLQEPDLLFIDPHAIVLMPAFCRLGPSTEYPALMVFDEGDAVGLLGTNPDRTWGQVEKRVAGEFIRCWMSYAVVDPVGEDDIPLAEFPPVPVEQEKTPSFSCSRYKSETQCMDDSRCTWVFGLGPGYCTAK